MPEIPQSTFLVANLKSVEVSGSIKLGNKTVTNLVDSATVASIAQEPETAAAITSAGGGGLDSAKAIVLIDSSYVQARQTTYDFLDSSETIALIDSSYVQARQDLAYSSLTGAPTTVSSFTNDANYLDSTSVQGVISASYIQSNQTTYTNADFTDSAYVTGLPVSTFTNDANYLDSTSVQGVISASYIQSNQTTYDFLDSSEAIALIDSAYVQARQTTYTTADFTDSAYVTGLPVSTFTNDANYLDSTSVQGVINASYIQSNQTTYTNADFADSSFVTTQINNLIDGAPGTLNTLNEIAAALNDDDSAYATLVGLINAKSDLDSTDAIALIDSDYVQARQTTGTDSAATISLIQANSVDSAEVIDLIDSAYVQARQTAGSTATVSDNAPSSPSAGDLWFNSTNATMYVYYNDGSSSQWVSISGYASSGGSTSSSYVEISSNTAAEANKKYIVDTSSAITITLPASPSLGDEIKVIDGTSNAGTNNITINRNSNKILGVDSDFIIDVNRTAVDLVYYNTAQGWIISGNT